MDRYGDKTAQFYKGGVYNRSLTDEIIPSAPDGEFLSLSYQTLGEIVACLSRGLRQRGIQTGDRVGIYSHTRMEWALSDFAVLTAGAAVTTVYRDSSPHQVQYLLRDSGARSVILENERLLERVLAVGDLDLDLIVVMDELDPIYRERSDVLTLADLYGLGRDARTPEDDNWVQSVEPDDLASIVYTSGTTGKPKGVQLTHANFRANINQTRRRFGPRADRSGDLPTIDTHTKTVSFLPLAHVFERLAGHFLMFASGAAVAYAETPDTLVEDMQLIEPNALTSVPRVYEKAYQEIRARAAESPFGQFLFEWASSVGKKWYRRDNPGPWLRAQYALADRLVFRRIHDTFGGNIDFFVSGGGSLSPELGRLFQGMGLKILEGYGLTETSPVVAANPPEQPRVGTLGPPVVDLEYRLDDSMVADEQRVRNPGKVGELLVKGDNVTSGYWEKPDRTREAFTEDGWFRTGDILAEREDGYLQFVERIKQVMVLSTGKNIAPGPIEDRFSTSEKVQQCMVIGDERKFVSALIVPDFEAMDRWAKRVGVELPPDRESRCEHPRVREWIREEVEEMNEQFEDHEQIKEFILVPREWTSENDMMTPSMKFKRRNILEEYRDQIDALYE